MKKYFLLLASAVFAFSITACDQSLLDEPQQGVVAETDFYKTDDDCMQALAGVYSGIFHTHHKFYTKIVALCEMLGDNAYKGSSGYKIDHYHELMLSIFGDDNEDISDVYEAFFTSISRANAVIQYFGEGTSEIQRRAVAEAKVMRSWAYVYLTTMWGTPPIIDHVLTKEDMSQPNATREDLWKFIIKGLDEAISSGALYSKSDVNDKSKVRATLEFAYAVKGKAQVFSGDYAGAKTSLEKVINSKKYALIPGPQLLDLFYTSAGNLSTESVFETNVITTDDNYKTACTNDQWAAYCTPRVDKHKVTSGTYLSNFKTSWGYYNPNIDLIKAMAAHETMDSYRFKTWFFSYEDCLDLGIVEFNESRSSDNKKFIESSTYDTPSTKAPTGIGKDYAAECAGFWTRKNHVSYEDLYEKNYEYCKVNRRYLRYAEVLLLYAEACAQLGETSGPGLDALNEVSERAGAPLYDKLTMDNVKQETRFEMFLENRRFFDLVRWGDAEKVLNNHYNELPVFFGYKPGKTGADLLRDGSNIEDVYEIRWIDVKGLRGGYDHHFRKGKDEVLPFPRTELTNNPALVQNAGW